MDNLSSNNLIKLPLSMIKSQQQQQQQQYRKLFEPYCIVWCSLPWLSYFIPLIGHMAITDSYGNIWDFSESYFVSKNNFSFGQPIKFLRMDRKCFLDHYQWDEGIQRAANIYNHKMHYILWSNCHSFVCEALNQMSYNGHNNHNVQSLLWKFSLNSHYVSIYSFIKIWSTWLIIITIFILIFLPSSSSSTTTTF
ncbi:hypothetical protein DERP_003382 [Dermatophagoides pteronyssinus]|uniref:Transmembrane protein 222-like n=1 Tax=Dermatophagoides pteronyssinus TaxID=6956 RepID=A0ABQ8JJC9_DERPT|nr:hypothetical protein DERP_003382 [Dermatophagoides pteronyssinus]